MQGEPSLRLRNAFNGETFIFPTGLDRGTARFDVILEAGGSGGGNALVHIHPVADETFAITSGSLVVIIDGKEYRLEAGQTATVPRGAPHSFRNAGEGPAEFSVSFDPPQHQLAFFRNFALLAERRPEWFSAKGDPHLLLIALVLNSYRDHLYLAGIPVFAQKLLFACLAPIARWRGYSLEIVMGAIGGGSDLLAT